MADSGAGAAIFLEQGVGVTYANPYPTAGVSLIAFGEENGAAAAGDRGEDGSLPIEFEAKMVDVVKDAGGDVLDAEDGDVALEDGRWCGFGWRHGGSLRISGDDNSARKPKRRGIPHCADYVRNDGVLLCPLAAEACSGEKPCCLHNRWSPGLLRNQRGFFASGKGARLRRRPLQELCYRARKRRR